MKRAILFAFSRQGCKTAVRIAKALDTEYVCEIYSPEKYAGGEILSLPEKIRDYTGKIFTEVPLIVYVGSCGIAVRAISPYLNNKTVDPAVLCVDELAGFCIPLLSGHIGGGNRLARKLAERIQATPVVTTATDINQRFSVDEWAARQGYAIGSMDMAKEVSAAILERDIPICADVPIKGELKAGLLEKNNGELGISVSIYRKCPYDRTLALIPKVLTLGIGCRKGISKDAVEHAVKAVFEEYQLDERGIRRVASIDLKAQEEGLLAFCEAWNLPSVFYTSEELKAVEGEFGASEFVRSITGVDNVCERSAVFAGGRLLVRKTVHQGVTVAVAEAEWEVNFE